MRITPLRDLRQPRRGTIYVLVLISSSIVATIGLASLQLLRLQGQRATGGNDMMEARLYARAAIEIGMVKVRNDPKWRNTLGNGFWVTNQSIGSGMFSIKAVDPIDNDVSTGANHPVILTGTGVKGTAVFSTSVRLEVALPTGTCLEVSMISNGNTTVTGATLTSDQTVSSNGTFTGSSGATINANVQASSIKGSTYTKSKTSNVTARALPDPTTVFSYYTDNGTAIPYSSLPRWTQPEMITNPGFETDTSSWYALGSCTLQRSSNTARQGNYSLYVSNRSNSSAVAAQDLVSSSLTLLSNGHQFNFTLPILSTSFCNAQVNLTIHDSTGATQTFSSQSSFLFSYNWYDLNVTLIPTWTGTVTKATVNISMDSNSPYYTDNASLTDITYPYNAYVIDRQVISPSVNPFGTSTNSQGIYVINCNGNDVIIGDSRIVGTLVFTNPGSNSALQGAISWEPAVVNYPTLMADQAFDINFNSAGLSESTTLINYNPAGTPYPFLGGTSNTTATDSYPSKINGLVYCASDLTFTNAPTISGVTVAAGKIKVNTTSLNLQYLSSYLSNPPPGFELGQTTLKPVPGTWKRSVN
ncbi:MAG: Carbohydrate-binding, CenC-like domain protein [Planctomycetaceae bacterium]|nr:Carbohydrate-binding, CenC-like domain protein [Planctomycetaceae bacterium]